jgi:hypothetical protein
MFGYVYNCPKSTTLELKVTQKINFTNVADCANDPPGFLNFNTIFTTHVVSMSTVTLSGFPPIKSVIRVIRTARNTNEESRYGYG